MQAAGLKSRGQENCKLQSHCKEGGEEIVALHPDEKRLEGLSKQLDWDVRSIQRWFRQRRNQEKPSTLKRFCESITRQSLD
ncbi:hypothetical protein CB1_000638011 [Camelus ferus]|nr:hypothetical protein CB1_000638011 [Camelus ferus]